MKTVKYLFVSDVEYSFIQISNTRLFRHRMFACLDIGYSLVQISDIRLFRYEYSFVSDVEYSFVSIGCATLLRVEYLRIVIRNSPSNPIHLDLV